MYEILMHFRNFSAFSIHSVAIYSISYTKISVCHVITKFSVKINWNPVVVNRVEKTVEDWIEKIRVENRVKNEIKIESEIVSNPDLCLVQISHFLIFLLLQALCSNFDSFGNHLQLAWLKNISKLVFKRYFGGKWAILEWNWRWKSI